MYNLYNLQIYIPDKTKSSTNLGLSYLKDNLKTTVKFKI